MINVTIGSLNLSHMKKRLNLVCRRFLRLSVKIKQKTKIPIMKILIFDVMLDGRFVCTLRYKYYPAVPVSVGKLIDFVINKCPTLKGKPFRILI